MEFVVNTTVSREYTMLVNDRQRGSRGKNNLIYFSPNLTVHFK